MFKIAFEKQKQKGVSLACPALGEVLCLFLQLLQQRELASLVQFMMDFEEVHFNKQREYSYPEKSALPPKHCISWARLFPDYSKCASVWLCESPRCRWWPRTS